MRNKIEFMFVVLFVLIAISTKSYLVDRELASKQRQIDSLKLKIDYYNNYNPYRR